MASASRRMRRANGMKNSAVRKALESGTPLNALYGLIPLEKRVAFKKFAARMGISEMQIQTILEHEKQRTGTTDRVGG